MMTSPELKVVIGAGAHHNNPGWLHTQEQELSLTRRQDWEAADGVIFRSRRYDPRNRDGVLRCVSLIVDAVKV